LIGVSRVNPFFSAIASICQKIQVILVLSERFKSSFSDAELFIGISFFSSMLDISPSRYSDDRRPVGIKEKVWGAGP